MWKWVMRMRENPDRGQTHTSIALCLEYSMWFLFSKSFDPTVRRWSKIAFCHDTTMKILHVIHHNTDVWSDVRGGVVNTNKISPIA